MKICVFGDAKSIHIQKWCFFLVNEGFEVHLISFSEIDLNGIFVHYVHSGNIKINGGNWKVLLSYRKVKQLIKSIKPDILNAHYATSYGITGALLGFHPYVITAHGSDVLIAPNNSKIIRVLLRWALKRSNWIISVAPHITSAISHLIGNSEKVDTISNGINNEVFNIDSTVEKREKFTIVSTRNFEEVYNIKHLLKSFSEVVKIIPNSELILIGEGSLEMTLKKMTEKLGIEKNVLFTGKLTQKKIASILNESHIYVSVSTSDGDSLSLSEAMACGCYCIVTDIEANRYKIKDGFNGGLVEINDIDKLYKKIIYSHENYEKIQLTSIPYNIEHVREYSSYEKNMKLVVEGYKRLVHLNKE